MQPPSNFGQKQVAVNPPKKFEVANNNPPERKVIKDTFGKFGENQGENMRGFPEQNYQPQQE